MGEGFEQLEADDLATLAHTLLARDKGQKGYRQVTLMVEWGYSAAQLEDEAEVARVYELLNEEGSPFKGKKSGPRRTYRIRHHSGQVITGKGPVSKSEVPEQPKSPVSESGRMNQAKAAANARRLFAKTGLRRVGQHPAQGVLSLRFNFPHVATYEYAERIKELAELTGWTVKIHPNANLQAIRQAVVSILPRSVKIKSFSTRLERGLVDVVARWEPNTINDEQLEVIAAQVMEMTGMELLLKNLEADVVFDDDDDGWIDLETPQVMSVHDTRRCITERLEAEGARVYSVVEVENELDVRFLTPQVGERFSSVLNELEFETGRYIEIDENPHEPALVALVNELLPRDAVLRESNTVVTQNTFEIRITPYPTTEQCVGMQGAFAHETNGWRLRFL